MRSCSTMPDFRVRGDWLHVLLPTSTRRAYDRQGERHLVGDWNPAEPDSCKF